MNSKTKVLCDHNQSEGFHDCCIMGVYSDNVSARKAEISIQCPSCGARLTVVMDKIVRMSVHDFWEGNIIRDIVHYEWPDMPVEWLRDLYHAGDFEIPSEMFGRILDSIRDEKMVLVHVRPSYGCEILALCKSVSVDTIENGCSPPSRTG